MALYFKRETKAGGIERMYMLRALSWREMEWLNEDQQGCDPKVLFSCKGWWPLMSLPEREKDGEARVICNTVDTARDWWPLEIQSQWDKSREISKMYYQRAGGDMHDFWIWNWTYKLIIYGSRVESVNL